VPVRVALDPKELAEHPLRVGLSMDAKVDVSNTDGKMLADVQRSSAVAQTAVFDLVNQAADGEVRKIIASNLGHALKADTKVAARRSEAATPAAAAGETVASSAVAAAVKLTPVKQ